MNPSALFINRPVATTLLTLGVTLAGAVAFFQLPVAPLPQVDFPTISVQAQLPGASPEVAASSAARVDLPASLRSNPTYRKVNPADAPILILALTSSTLTPGQVYDAATTVLEQKLSQVEGIGQVNIGGSSLPAVRVELNPSALFKYSIGLEDVRAALAAANAHAPKGAIEDKERRFQIYTNDQAREAAAYRSLIVGYRDGAAIRLSDVAEIQDSVENLRNAGLANGRPSV